MNTKENKLSFTGTEASELLSVEAWWRTYTPDELQKFKDNTQAIFALAAYVQTDPAHWLETDGGLALDRELFAPGLIKTGLERLRTNICDDVAGTWFLLSYLFDDQSSLVAILMRELLLRSMQSLSSEKGPDARMTERRQLKLVNSWSDLVQSEPGKCVLTEQGLDTLNSNWRNLTNDDWFLEGRWSQHTKQKKETEADKGEEVDVEIVPGPVHVVLKEIGDLASNEGKKISQTYASLVGSISLSCMGVSADILQTALSMEFPWMSAAIDHLTGDLRLLQKTGTTWCRFRPLLLVGPPGVGKTRFARKLARLVGTGYQEINAAGSCDNRMLAGTARGWSSAQPALPLLAMLRGKTANPVCVVDEIDKAGSNGGNGDMRATLLAMLEPETASTWFDECLLASCDLSQVSWILTANSLKGLPASLLSRLMVVNVDGPEPDHFDVLVNGILWDLCEELNVTYDQLPELEPEVIEALRGHFTRMRSARRLKNAITAAMAHTMVKSGTRMN